MPLLIFVVVKQRMQMCCSPYSGCTNAAITVYKTEGIRAFYRSYFTQLAMNVPFQASLVTTYMSIQRFVNPKNEYNPTVHFVAGALAGGVASTVTMPFDNCKTLLNTQEAGVLKKIEVSEINGLMGAAKSVRRMVGFRGFFSGLTPRILYQAPSTAISWSVYEFVKYCMKKNQDKCEFDNCETLASLKEQTDKQQSGRIEAGRQSNETDSPGNKSVKDEQSVGSSVGHTISLNSDITLPLPRSLSSISNPKFLSASSTNVKDGCEHRTVDYS